MRKFSDWLTAFTCRRFSTHVAQGVEPLAGGWRAQVQFWIHYAICPFCRRYWKEIAALGQTQREVVAQSGISLDGVKNRLRSHLKSRPL